MAVVSGYTLPKGNSGMTLYGSSNDDTTVSLPEMPFGVKYNNTEFKVIYTSGNSWIGFGGGAEHLRINRRDASYNRLYYANETEYGVRVFRIRFEGNSYYSSWNTNDLVWEFTIFEDGVFRLVIEKSPNNASDGFTDPSLGSQTFTFTTGKSYVFIPQNEAFTSYLVQEGSYIPCANKYLMEDEEGIKSYTTIDGVSAWVKIGEAPVTFQMFNEYGSDTLPISMEGLKNTPKLHYYTDNPNIIAEKEKYVFEVKQVVTSRPKLVIQCTDFIILPGRTVKQIVAAVSLVRKNSSGGDISTEGKIRLAFSIDGGNSYYTYNKITAAFEPISISNITEFMASGILPSDLPVIDYTAFNLLVAKDRTLRFAYLLEKPSLTDVCKLKAVKIFYN